MENMDIKSFADLSAVKGFKVAHLNIRIIVKKIDQIRILLQNTSIDIFTLSETWLKPNLQSALFKIDGYKLFRQDREFRGKRWKRGGGLLTYVKESLLSSCEQITDLDVSSEDIEA